MICTTAKTLNICCKKFDSWGRGCSITATALWVPRPPTLQSPWHLLYIYWWHTAVGYRFWVTGSETASHFVCKDSGRESLKCQGARERGQRKRECQHETETSLAEESWWIRLFNSGRAPLLKPTAGPRGKPRGPASFSLQPYSPMSQTLWNCLMLNYRKCCTVNATALLNVVWNKRTAEWLWTDF